jgi:hypothetical protein
MGVKSAAAATLCLLGTEREPLTARLQIKLTNCL